MMLRKAIMKVITFLLFFFFFTCSLDILSSAFQLIAGKVAREFLFGGPILFNPIACAMLGLLATVVVQSSSISASVLVSLVSSSFLTVETAIPVMMGVNVGTAITNILVALMYAGDREEFGRVFAGATVHSFFNWLTVLVLLPLELITGFLYHLSYRIMRSFKFQADDDDDDDGPELLKALTGPLTNIIIQLNKKVFTELAAGNQEAKNKSLIKIWCKTFENVTFSNVTVPSPENCTSPTLCWTEGNITWTLKNRTYQQNIAKCKHLFVNTSLSDSVIGFILLPLSLFILCGCLILFIRVLNSELRGPVAAVIKKYINTDFPFPFTWLAGYLVILVGALLTFLVQSSSVFTSTITPLVGTEVISLERVYCLTLGSNIGTTTTAILAALASPPRTFKQSLQIALCHFFFNITGILLWYPIPFIRLPLLFARRLGNITTTYRWFAIVYLIFSFFLGPLLVFCFSIASRTVLIYVGLPLYFLPFVVVYLHIFNVLKLFPLWMRDLKPWDDLITSIMVGCRQCGENLSHQWKKLQGPTLKPDPGPDQNHRPRAIEDSLFYVKKSDDTVSKNTINKWAVLNDSSAD
ncbi:sodium-dependent phosphate transport protein 2B-like isoform X3 [Monodelphis domestica]|uniref:sodium-dependent phosphate transport protein 2B-like isoform X3 n=1 Tax=Monodelphis domestica TaxID=13616 RepID=UPI0024E1F6A6|nr:sodium-dependent phosphate transport protein 2B-like isoform X3 [Monodelphis domestica]XP_056658475.1 sodium-dependent phosphate transport protein 2B-like isoform X3 [Monodelphis domestica]XP_056658476.1 sodium-dependent phosphate transport protein 2B-like isoform X3 [Monodelphis domestica]